MLEALRHFQLSFMIFLSGCCGVLAILAYATRVLSKDRRNALVNMEIGAMLLLISDYLAYRYRGSIGETAFWMVRICNFLVYFLINYVIFSFNRYLVDLLKNEGRQEKIPILLVISKKLFYISVLFIIISQFTGVYYTFDEYNRYHRGPGFELCYMIPLVMSLFQIITIVRYRKCLEKRNYVLLMMFSILPYIASIVQVFAYGFSLTNITIVGNVVVVYIFEIFNLNRAVERANKLEIEYLKAEQRRIRRMFEQTAGALVSAIDAKDPYTHGHSIRVAAYARMIAREAGKSNEECDEIYYSALLHDIGKIGIDDLIINKSGKLSKDEFASIKLHTIIGDKILESIHDSEFLSIGAKYHHERYDGKGYPNGLAGEDIPEAARIIAIADAYDAMTSTRSYRGPMKQELVREEFVKGSGTQFDPNFVEIMIKLIDRDTEFHMHENAKTDLENVI